MAIEPAASYEPWLSATPKKLRWAVESAAFGNTEQRFALKPITLLFGANSGGKSSLLQYFLWVKDVIDGHGLDLRRLKSSHGMVDLGGFRQFRHGDNPAATVRSRLSFAIDRPGRDPIEIETFSEFSNYLDERRFWFKLESEIVRNLRAATAPRVSEALPLAESEALPAIEALIKMSAHSSVSLRPLLEKVIRETLPDIGGNELELYFLEDPSEEHDNDLQSLLDKEFPGIEKRLRAHELVRLLVGLLPESTKSANIQKLIREEFEVTDLDALENVLVIELQSLARRTIEEQKWLPLFEESNPTLIGFELSSQGQLRISAKLCEQGELAFEALDVPWLCEVLNHADSDSEPASCAAEIKKLRLQKDRTLLPSGVLREEDGSKNKDGSLALIASLLDELIPLCHRGAKNWAKNFSYLGPLRSYPERTISMSDIGHKRDAQGLFAWRLIFENEDIRKAVNHWLSLDNVSSGLEVIADRTISWSYAKKLISLQIRYQLERWQRSEASGRQLEMVENAGHGYNASAAEELDAEELVEKAMRKVESALCPDEGGTIYLRDLRTGKQVSSRDIGVGVSQLIPILVEAKASSEGTILIEQPELHVHPALQAELGDVLIESVFSRGNTFLIETHSEHLLLRIMRRIRQTASGTLPEGAIPIRPEDVNILHVGKTEYGSLIQEMPLNERGELVKAWPGGFFEEGLNEMFD